MEDGNFLREQKEFHAVVQRIFATVEFGAMKKFKKSLVLLSAGVEREEGLWATSSSLLVSLLKHKWQGV